MRMQKAMVRETNVGLRMGMMTGRAPDSHSGRSPPFGVSPGAMFYTQQVLSRRGSLGTIWIAAHLDKKLKRQQISDTDIRESVGKR